MKEVQCCDEPLCETQCRARPYCRLRRAVDGALDMNSFTALVSGNPPAMQRSRSIPDKPRPVAASYAPRAPDRIDSRLCHFGCRRTLSGIAATAVIGAMPVVTFKPQQSAGATGCARTSHRTTATAKVSHIQFCESQFMVFPSCY